MRPDHFVEELRRGLELPGAGRDTSVVGVRRRSSPYRSSFPLEELDVLLSDGTRLELVLKDLSPAAPSKGVRAVKPLALHDPLREIEVYRTILAEADLGTPAYYGALLDPARGRFWLFLERVPGGHLHETDDPDSWRAVARWAAGLHARFADGVPGRSTTTRLLRFDAAFYRHWMRRAREFARGGFGSITPHSAKRGIERVARRYEEALERFEALPTTLVHGELYASNVLLAGERICPVDWEMAGLGPGALDLAAISAGSVTPGARRALAGEYLARYPQESDWPPPLEELLRALDVCRLHVAVQWLGWARAWTPPPEHRHDWLGDALRLTEELGL